MKPLLLNIKNDMDKKWRQALPRLLLLALSFATIQLSLRAQNLVNNAGFETYSALPSGAGQYSLATGWNNCFGSGSPDYFHTNGTGYAQLPNSYFATVSPQGGDAIMGLIIWHSNTSNFREYLSHALAAPLTIGQLYTVSFYITNGVPNGNYGGDGADQMSVAFSTNSLTQSASNVISNVTPKYVMGTVLYDTAWQQFSFSFVADSAYSYITFGSFVNDASTIHSQFAPAGIHAAYYFIDGIECKIASAQFANTCMGDTTFFTNPAQTGMIAISWNFGDTASGTNNLAYITNAYHVFSDTGNFIVTTINYYLGGNNDTLITNVTISSPPAFDLGNDTTICAGTSLTLSVNQGFTGYQWSTGDTTYSVSVATAGNYYVTVSNNGCISTDSINVTLVNCSAPVISLQSSDTNFCEKKCIDFYDLSANNPTSWQWFFPGADSTTSTLQNPTNICYNSYGSFDVTLIACNAAGCDTLLLPNFINEYPAPVPTITQSNDTLLSSPGVSYQWWNVSTGIIAGATNSYYIPTTGGDYYCIVTDTIGCAGSSNVITVSFAGIMQLAAGSSQLAINPNPNNGSFIISLSNLISKDFSLHIVNPLGQIIQIENGWRQHQPGTNTQINIELGDVAKGLYAVEIINNGMIYTGRFLKE